MMPRPLVIGVVVMFALAMGVYLGRVRRTASIETAADKQPVAPPVWVQPSRLRFGLRTTILVPCTLNRQESLFPLGGRNGLKNPLRALMAVYLDKTSPHSLGGGSEIRDVYLVDPGLAVIDTNSAFADGHRSGVLVEELTIASMVQTLSTNIPGILRVKILVDGKQRETLAGHADLSNPYDVSAINQLMNQLQSSPQL